MMNSGGMADMLREAMEKKQGGGGEAISFAGQYASTVRREQAPDGSMREFVWITQEAEPDVSASDEEWSNAPGVKKVYGSWNEYAISQDDEGNMMIADDDFVAKQDESGNYVLDESTMDGQDRGREAGREAQGGPGASKMEDLMEMLGGMGGQGGAPAPGKQYAKGGRFPDLNRDGKVTMADILMGRGVRR